MQAYNLRRKGPAEKMESVFDHVGSGEFDRIHILHRRPSRSARWTPQWAADDSKIRLVVFNYLASHKRKNSHKESSISVRDLDRQLAAIYKETLRKSEAGLIGDNIPVVKHARIVGERGHAAYYTAIIYRAYRQGMRAPDIAEEFGMSNVSVRMVLKRLNDCARKLFPGENNFKRHPTASRITEIVNEQRLYKRIETKAEHDKRHQRITELFDEGKTRGQIAQITGWPLRYVRGVFSALNLKTGYCGAKPKKYPEVNEEMAFWRSHGVSYRDMGWAFGIGTDTVRRRLKELAGEKLPRRVRDK